MTGQKVHFLLGTGFALVCSIAHSAEPAPQPKPISFYKDIRPILQANCQGCHQPAKSKGGYVMTDFQKLLAPGDSKETPIVPNQPDASHLLKLIVPNDKGEAEMPKGKPPLPDFEIGKVRQWITEGAKDDTPPNARQRYDAEHPPVYSRAPVIAGFDISPDGSLIAVAGFHEILLHKADGSGLAGRLIGLSDRIQSVRFSPDGKMLAAAGGQPSRLGEIQIWDVGKRTLISSVSSGYDTLYGVSWSPDGTQVAFGCPDKTVRAIEASSGKQILQQGSHNDWVLDTVFSTNGSHVISVGRDMSAKLTEVPTQRFVDNITSITPGALRGGLQAVARHPSRDEVLVGGADGVPQIYRVFRQTARKIGDNANLIRRYPAMEGRIFGVSYSPDGKRIAAGASLDGHGSVQIFASDFDSTLTPALKTALEKEVFGQSAEEKAAIEKFVTADTKVLASTVFTNTAIYAVKFTPDGSHVVATGSDGLLRWIDAASGKLTRQISVAPKIESSATTTLDLAASGTGEATNLVKSQEETLPENSQVESLSVSPAEASLGSRNEHVQLVVTARLAGGSDVDVTRMVSYEVSDGIGSVDALGRFSSGKAAKGSIRISMQGKHTECKIDTSARKDVYKSDFIQDVNPILSKLGCNAGTCHGAKDGKNGFKMSLRGYDPLYDLRALTDDHASRRVAISSPDDSLMLLKATGAVPHEGGQRTSAGSEYYSILRQWIATGGPLNLVSPKVTRIEVLPKDPVVQVIGAKQQMRVVASYADGRTRDVTAEAFLESGNLDVVTADASGLVTTLRRGEAPVLARYEGAYAATTVTVMGDRKGFVWKDQPAHNRVDELVAEKWKRMKILPSDLATDAEFLRRVYLDLTGLPPTPEAVRQFLKDKGDTRVKRDEVIDRLIGSREFVDHWANKWADLLQVNRKFLGEEGAQLFRDWIHKQVESNTPYDEFVRKVITATGSNRENPPAAYYKVLRTPTETMENTTHLFLATRFNCNKCHDHPFERWTQDQYYQMSAFFAQVDLQTDPVSGDRRIGGTAVEGAKPLFEVVKDKDSGDVTHERTGKITPPDFPYPASFKAESGTKSRRDKLAAWMTSEDNRYFALSYVNRLWGYLMGVGLIDPLDDIRAGNPPSNPALLDYLTDEFIRSGFNARRILRLICQSRAYQLSVIPNEWNSDDRINFSRATARRLPAEVLMDAVYSVAGSTLNVPGARLGTRAAQLLDSALDVPSGFLANLGRPPRESSCECERSNDIRLGSVMSLLSGPAVSGAIHDPKNELARLAREEKDDRHLAQEVFLRVLGRPATDKEVDAALKDANGFSSDHAKLTNDLAKAEAAWLETKAKKDKERADAISKAENELNTYLIDQAPKVARAERGRQERISAAEQKLGDFEPLLPGLQAAWESKLGDENLKTRWQVAEVKEAKGTGAARVERQSDGTVRSFGSSGQLTDHVITLETGLAGITGIKIEALTAEGLPAFGPGLKDGNFMLSEILVDAASRTNASKTNRLKIASAKADHVEKDHDLKHCFDGKAEQGRKEGWSIGGAASQPHWAAFAFESPTGTTEGSTLKVTLQFRYQADHEIGRYRIWVTTSQDAAAPGLPGEIQDIVRVSPPLRSPAQTARMISHYREVDTELLKLEQALSRAKAPLPEDEKVKDFKRALAKASKPVLTDPALIQFREDAAHSARQLANPKLTLAQDLAWALINTPSFIFNR